MHGALQSPAIPFITSHLISSLDSPHTFSPHTPPPAHYLGNPPQLGWIPNLLLLPPRLTSASKPAGLSKAVELSQGPPASRCHMIRKRITIDIHQLTQTNLDLNLPLNTNLPSTNHLLPNIKLLTLT
jgi:hypothetical protein